ncbi:hypothetical protein EGW08_019929 [Elysia chlorotica]|uniref:G-protein coupled receptors family 1 profile domain-containing protein n=1 Tax=Elysia chlorotica TaxID=188477 RepID=A0A433SSR9_ELYCH|nr:hypothetical protein EGW08_019929 [Elysia chlorotica]
MNAALHLFLPFFFIALLTSFIIYGLQKSRKHRMSLMRRSDGNGEEMTALKNGGDASKKSRSHSAGNTATNKHNQKMLDDAARVERTITLMLIAAGVIFLVLSLPMTIYYIVHGFTHIKRMSVKEARWALYHMVCFVFIDSSHAINFFLYFCTAKRFRTQLIRIVTWRAACWGRRMTRRANTAGSNGNHADSGASVKTNCTNSTLLSASSAKIE